MEAIFDTAVEGWTTINLCGNIMLKSVKNAFFSGNTESMGV